MMIKLRGLRVRRGLSGLWRGLLRCNRRRCRSQPRRESYLRLDQSPDHQQATRDCTFTGKILSWTRRLCPLPFGGRRAESPATTKPSRDQCPAKPPKGHLVVYVGREEEAEDGDMVGAAGDGFRFGQSSTPQRVVVPVVYFNHPLFAELLRESERKYGFNHPGGITLPCPYSDFESVRTRVAAAASAGLCCRSPAGLKRRWHLKL